MSSPLTLIKFLRRFRRPLALLAPHRRKLVVGMTVVVVYSLLKLWMTHILGGAVDAVGRGGMDMTSLRQTLVLLVVVILVETVCHMASRQLIIHASRGMEVELKSRIFAHMNHLPATWFDRARVGDLLSRMTQDVELVRFLVGPAILYGLTALTLVPPGLVMMFYLSPVVAGLVVAVILLLLVAMTMVMPRMQKYSQRVQEDIAGISQWAQESFSGIRVLMNFAKAQSHVWEMARRNQTYLEDNMRMVRFRTWFHLLVHLSTDLTILAVMVVGALEVMAGRLTVGDMFQFLLIMGFLTGPLMAVGWVLGMYHRAVSAMDRIEAVMQTPPEPEGGKTMQLLGRLEVRDLHFQYPESEGRPILEGISFRLEPGQKLGLVGPVGSGKSTLLALIMRLYDPPRGTVFVDGTDILDLDLKSLRRVFALAPQEPFLFSDTIAGNVGFGGDGAEVSQDMMEAAVHAAALDQDLDDLAEGMYTLVGERGVTLSGGQRQRVSLARALASRRPALVLDDTLSAVDTRTEARILERLRRRDEGGTRQSMLVASHRLSVVRDADLILVLKEGRVVEQGQHQELLAKGGTYAQAWRMQQEAQALAGGV